jgi:hypothetical protein
MPATSTRSASFRTTKGSEPPSSRTVGFSARPAAAPTAAPARSLPVRVTAATRGSAINLSVTAGVLASETRRVANSPGGKPASRKSRSIATAQPDTLGECFSSAPFPAISAGAAKRTTCQNGKFHGMIATTTPIGSKTTRLSSASVSTRSSARNCWAFRRRSHKSKRTCPLRPRPRRAACPSRWRRAARIRSGGTAAISRRQPR